MKTLKAILFVSMTLATIGCDSDDVNIAPPVGPDGTGQDSGEPVNIDAGDTVELLISRRQQAQ